MAEQITRGSGRAKTSSSELGMTSVSTPDSFIYETKYVVLSFISHLTQEQKNGIHASSTSTESDQRTKRLIQRWKAKSLPCSPPKHKRKTKKSPVVIGKHKHFSSDESIHRPSKFMQSGEESYKDQSKTESQEEKSKLGGSHSLPLQGNYSEVSDIVSPSKQASAPGLYIRSVSEDSSRNGGSYLSDADDELDTSQGSSLVGSLGGSDSHNREMLQRISVQHRQGRLSTVPSESETELESADRSKNSTPVCLDMIKLQEKTNGFSYHIDRTDERKNSICDEVDGNTMSDVSDSDFHCDDDDDGLCAKADDDDGSCAKADDDDAKESGDEELGAAGGFASFNTCCVDRSQLFLELGRPAPVDQSDELEFLEEELDDEMHSLESEIEEAIRSQRMSRLQSPFNAPLTPHMEAAHMLAMIGDEISEQHALRLESVIGGLLTSGSGMFTYEAFRDTAQMVLDDSVPGWGQVALLLIFSQRVAVRMINSGQRGINNIVDYAVKLVADISADFIIRQGGWSAIVSTESSESSSPALNSLPGGSHHPLNPFTFPLNTRVEPMPDCSVEVGRTVVTKENLNEEKSEESREITQPRHETTPSRQYSEKSYGAAVETECNSNEDIPWYWERFSFVVRCSVTVALFAAGLGLSLALIRK